MRDGEASGPSGLKLKGADDLQASTEPGRPEREDWLSGCFHRADWLCGSEELVRKLHHVPTRQSVAIPSRWL